MLRRSSRAGLAIALVVLLSACVEATRLPAAEPSPSVAPLFASDEEALAAAVEAYEEYLAVVDQALQGVPGAKAELDTVATGIVLDEALSAVASFERDGYRSIGLRHLRSSTLQQAVTLDQSSEVTIYVCEDATLVDVVNLEGTSVVSSDRPNLTPLEVTVLFESDLALVQERGTWMGGGVCEEQ